MDKLNGLESNMYFIHTIKIDCSQYAIHDSFDNTHFFLQYYSQYTIDTLPHFDQTLMVISVTLLSILTSLSSSYCHIAFISFPYQFIFLSQFLC